MGIRGKDFRGELDPALHEKLKLMADHVDKDVGKFGCELLEKAIAGEWHAFSLMLERASRAGIMRKAAEKPVALSLLRKPAEKRG